MAPAAALRKASGVSLAALALSGCLAGGATTAPQTPAPAPILSNAAIWMHPLPAGAWPGPPPGGSSDYLNLFAGDVQWPRVAAHTSVFGMYAGWIAAAGPSGFAQIVAFLNAHHMGIEVEAPALQATPSCGSGVEGYAPLGGPSLHDFTLTYLSQLRAAGADLRYIKVDEPYFFGSVAPDPRSCHWPVAQVAAYVLQFVQLVHTVYPNVQVGDVEPIIASAYPTDVVTAISQWHQAYAAAAGAPFPFFVADIDYSNPSWPTLVKALETSTHEAGSQFGIIYIGDFTDSSDQMWASKAVMRFQTYQGVAGGKPDFILFQSWMAHPLRCLPETDPTTFTGVVKAYIDATSPLKRPSSR